MAIAYNSDNSEFKKLQLECLMKNPLEIIAAVGKKNGVKKKHILIAAYLPPNYKRADNKRFLDCLIDVIAESKTKHPEAWLTLGGDWNGRS